ncbi:MAG: ornithine carbamoyltransferase [Candidatus Solibacter usitatus]|nr:ornithine carbamoyltransferase [Candidatus Solibacter usitatus]
MAQSHLRSDLDMTTGELTEILDLADAVKSNPKRYATALAGRYLALLFEKPSLRTRMTFELAIKQLGGDSVFAEGRLGEREPIEDVARNLDRWTHAIAARTFSQQTIEDLARWSAVPVINALSDMYHPCQALADFQTLREKFGELRGVKLAYCGDGNNVAHSLLLNASRLGVDFSIATPAAYQPHAKIVSQSCEFAKESGAKIVLTQDPLEAVQAAHAVYTDVWISMGQEAESERRKATMIPYQVDERIMTAARKDAIFMHCLPAKRGQEVAPEVIESRASAVFDQAENRLHAQKALLLMLLQ